MRSPLWALSWSVWRPYRWRLAACVAYCLALAVLGLLLPRRAWVLVAPEDGLIPAAALFILSLSAPALFFVLIAFSAIPLETHLDARESGFPARTFTLPVSTAVLVAVPMLQAMAAAAAPWVFWTGLVLARAGIYVDLIGPALSTLTLMAWLQALVWQPFPLRFLRVVVAVPVLAAVGMGPSFALALGAPPAVVVAVQVALLPAAYGVALAGVARARRGNVLDWSWPSRFVAAFASVLPRRRAPFESPLQAQTWFEWRMRGMGFPFMVGLVVVVWTLIVLTGAGERAVATMAEMDIPHGATAVIAVLTAPGLLLAVLLAFVPFLAAVAGGDLGSVRMVDSKQPGGTFGCHPFLALRPLTDGAMVLAKWQMAVRSTLTGWALASVGIFVGLGLSGQWRELASAPLLQTHGALEVCGALAAGGTALVLLTWLGLIANLWLGLTGRRWLSFVLVAVLFGVCLALVVTASWLSSHAAIPAALPYILAVAVLLKLLLAGWFARRLWRRGLVGSGVLATAAAGWLLAAVVGFALLIRFVPPDAASLVVLALGVVLFLPLGRLAAAPLALASNRHR